MVIDTNTEAIEMNKVKLSNLMQELQNAVLDSEIKIIPKATTEEYAVDIRKRIKKAENVIAELKAYLQEGESK
jgi:hypothetical protein